ncbi:hypothetical protein L249_0727 [Ophiocordyceps polyrhachis-furcata BCC 54312]|uniref:Uncharacterized protein n=1 Tax=Ophiocordyceps polyrhachis-furcata BCC 54312 TaxID=1330021 RepID=A0A367LEC6_9HYPO|nr:hypothetical protein L249_0727 [Ophiocordyceps polyrhachis-furcata BCC 54312]
MELRNGSSGPFLTPSASVTRYKLNPGSETSNPNPINLAKIILMSNQPSAYVPALYSDGTLLLLDYHNHIVRIHVDEEATVVKAPAASPSPREQVQGEDTARDAADLGFVTTVRPRRLLGLLGR